ncbi:MAG: trimeric intracellular cation channel family protein [Rhodocyclales bacterium]|nr:trimeric intracellular cation channel family protein [Rhodocyclales bacterium]
MTQQALLYWVGMAAVAVSALAGVLDARRKYVDLIGALLVGMATALGGGTVRDVLLDRPVFWVIDQTYLLVACLTSIFSFFTIRACRIPARALILPDAMGLALFTILGTQVALHHGAPWLVASLMGVTTGVVGGLLRDILCNDVPSILLKGELYATAAWIGAIALLGLLDLGFSPPLANGLAMLIVLSLRLLAVRYHLTLPAFGQDDSRS